MPDAKAADRSAADPKDPDNAHAEKIRVGYVINKYPFASHAAFRREILALEQHGAEVHRYSIRPTRRFLVDKTDIEEEKKTRTILSAGVLVLIWNFFHLMFTRPARFFEAFATAYRVGRGSDRGVLRHFAHFVEACTLLKWMEESGIQHVHAHFATNSTTVPMLARILGGPPYSFTVHGPDEFDKAIILSLEEKIRRAAFVVAISDFCRGQLYRWCGYEQWNKIKVVRCGLDDTYLDAEVTDVPATPRFVCVGRICEQKGQLLLVEAVARLKREGIPLELFLVGDGEMREEVEALVDRHDLHDCVKVTGVASSDEVREYIESSRAMVLPSFAEGLPMVLMEAMALGRPVISTYIAGVPELVDPGSCGWLITSGSIDYLTDAMRSALQTPVERLIEMGRQGRERAVTLHNSRTESGKLKEFFAESAELEGQTTR